MNATTQTEAAGPARKVGTAEQEARILLAALCKKRGIILEKGRLPAYLTGYLAGRDRIGELRKVAHDCMRVGELFPGMKRSDPEIPYRFQAPLEEVPAQQLRQLLRLHQEKPMEFRLAIEDLLEPKRISEDDLVAEVRPVTFAMIRKAIEKAGGRPFTEFEAFCHVVTAASQMKRTVRKTGACEQETWKRVCMEPIWTDGRPFILCYGPKGDQTFVGLNGIDEKTSWTSPEPFVYAKA